ncbi:hypothetical protein C8034_v010201 [Colletotrichum sidae]|uniref:Uncharacterized protein n=1 Tax=Colletotrichum sidae TaxID=1347389 RepID=A0A4R8TFR2_9PEZI|nr:hypothetical protein C8034_v010201 [Colletotrichum sidae]
MKSSIISLAAAANLVSAAGLRPRQDPASEAAAGFTSAADALISAYIPAPEWEALTSAVGSAAGAAGVTQDAKNLIYSALKATEAPEWFAAAVPTAYSSQYAALESAIDSLRPTVTVTVPGGVPTVIAVTTTDENGNTITASVSTTVTPIPTTITTNLVPTPSVSVTVVTGTNSEGSSFTSTVIATDASEPASSADTTVTATTTETAATETTTPTETTGNETGTETTGAEASGEPSSTEAPSESSGAGLSAHSFMAGVAALVAFVMTY